MSKYGVFSSPYFPVFGLNTEIYGVNLRTSPNTGKYGPENTPYLDTFHAVILNSILCCFWKAHSTQRALFKLIQSWQKEIDNHGFVGKYSLNGFVEGLYRISQELLISKLDSYRITKNSLKLILSYLSRHKQRIKIGSSVSAWYDVITGVTQRFLVLYSLIIS